MPGALTRFSQLDVLLPSQFFTDRGNQTPEYRLMIAVFRDALDCVEKYRHANDAEGTRLFAEATGWLLAEEADWLYSFKHICGILDLNPTIVLHRLQLTDSVRPRIASDTDCMRTAAAKGRVRAV